jgi:hypothetical protein
MKDQEIKRAVAMCRIFIHRAEQLEKAQNARGVHDASGMCPKESGALRRASMDVTRQLSAMRQS